MPCPKAYQKRHAKARQRRRRTAAERLQHDHAQAQRAIEALEQACTTSACLTTSSRNSKAACDANSGSWGKSLA